MIEMKKVSVLLPANTNSTYDYLSLDPLELGTLVSVPFRNKARFKYKFNGSQN